MASKKARYLNAHLVAGLVAVACVGLLSYLSHIFSPPGQSHGSSKEALLEFLLIGLLAAVVVEFIFFGVMMHGVEEQVEETAKIVADNKIKNDVINSYNNTILNIFEHDDTMVRRALVGAVKTFTPTIRWSALNPDTIELDSPYIAELVYQEFWRLVRQKQQAIASSGSGESITIFSSHATELDVWKNDELIIFQRDFMESGGSIYRIMIRNAATPDTIERFEAAMASMEDTKNNNAHIFLLDTKKIANRSAPLTDDYFIAKIDGRPYVMAWDAKWGDGYGQIKGCLMSVDRRQVDIMTSRWETLVEYLCSQKYPVNDNPNLTRVNREPEQAELDVMKKNIG